jgi:Peptidase M50B-like
MAHEGMHWAVGSLSGRKAWWIELKPNGDGGTLVLPDRGFGYLVVVFAGYLGPSAFGLGPARLIQFGHIIQVLWVGMLLLGLLLLMLKPSFGFITVPLAGFLIFLVLKNMSQRPEILAAYTITWFLLLAGVRRVWQRGHLGAPVGEVQVLDVEREHLGRPRSTNRPQDRLLTITTAQRTVRTSSTDGTANRTDSTGGTGIPSEPFHEPFHAHRRASFRRVMPGIVPRT